MSNNSIESGSPTAPTHLQRRGHMKLIAIIIATALCCVGCANNQSIREAVSASPQPTYQHLSKIPFEALVKGAPRLEEITTQTPAFPFSEGTSYFKAYALPTANDRNIHLTTFIVGSMNMPSAFVFYPYITFLDESFSAVLRVDPKLKYKNNFWDSERSGWATEVAVPPMAKYLVVHSPASKRGERLYYKDASYTPPGTVVPLRQGALYMPGNWWDVYLPAAGAGRFEIAIQ